MFFFFYLSVVTTGFVSPCPSLVLINSEPVADANSRLIIVRAEKNDGEANLGSSREERYEDFGEESGGMSLPGQLRMDMSNYSPPPQRRSADPLVNFMTDPGSTLPVDEDGATLETVDFPLIGEIPRDGTLLILAPAAVIGVLGFVMTFVVAFRAKDEIISLLEDVTLAPPPKAKVVKPASDCRGLCSSQDESLEYLRGVMGSLSKKKVEDVAKDVEEVAQGIEQVAQDVSP